MTSSAPRSAEPGSDWAAAQHSNFVTALGRHVTPEAGLRDIMLDAEHLGLAVALGSNLDIRAGLAAILPSPQAETPPPASVQLPVAAAVAEVDPATRIAMRRHPATLTLLLSYLVVRALEIPGERDLYPRVVALVHDLKRVSTVALGVPFYQGLDFRGDIELAAEISRAPTDDRVRELAYELAYSLVLDVEIDVTSAVGRLSGTRAGSYRALRPISAELAVSFRHLAAELACAQPDTVARDLASAKTLVSVLARLVGDALGLQEVEGLPDAVLEGAMDDFTSADLAQANLEDSDLTGIRWSEHGTAWPPGTNVGALRARSEQLAAGIYRIKARGRGGQARDHART